ncbi:MAG: aconitase X catalytic domain-containing protein [Methanomassiliicoccales archaeon]|jgi:predicted aconitase|nr:aconitase X catalytic domain-containing protein [Methanomassiliicoccales archaeon]
MYLTREEEAILDGEKGYGYQKAMELLVAIGTVYDADRLVPISSAHLSGVSYKTIGEGGLDFLLDISSNARVSVHTTLNPAGMDLTRWKEMGVSSIFARKQIDIVECYRRMGIEISCTCTPYLTTNVPRMGDIVAWAESSALSYVNSVIGARTNREGGPGALAAAIIGKTPHYGLHLNENRMPTVVVEADVGDGVFNHSLLGHAVGRIVSNGVPYFRGIRPSQDEIKTLAAAMAASGSIAIFHIEGVTPGADRYDVDTLEKIEIGEKELHDACESLNTGEEPELIALGCPHLSIGEMKVLAKFLQSRRKTRDIDVWFCTSRYVKERCKKEVEILEKFGKVVCDTCMVVAPIEDMYSCTATNSAKACNYLPTLCAQKVKCADCVELLGMIT